MRIAIISHFYPPEIGAPQARLSEMARTWVKHGHEVSVFTTFPNHPIGTSYPEYKEKIFLQELIDGVHVYRHWVYVPKTNRFLFKIINHLSFMVSVVFLSLFRSQKPDVYIVSSPTFFSVLSAWSMSWIRGVPYIFEVRDLWPGIFIELGVLKNKYIIWVLERIELFLYRRAKKVVVVTDGFKKDLIARGISASKIEVITNGVDVQFFQKVIDSRVLATKRKNLGFGENDVIVLYLGAHGISHSLETVLEAAEKLRDEKRIQFLFVGEGTEKHKLVSIAAMKQLTNVSFVEGCPRSEVPSYYALADICLVCLKDIAGFKAFIPSKIFEIMAAKKPFVALLRGEAAEILERSHGGIIIEPEDAESLSMALKEIVADTAAMIRYGDNAYQFVAKHYDRARLAENYLKIMA